MNAELRRVVREMVEVEGLYLLRDSRAPGVFVVVISTGGRLLAMSPTNELHPDRFLPTAVITPLLVTEPQ